MVPYRVALRLAAVGAAALPMHGDKVSELKVIRPWRLVEGGHWQIQSAATESAAQTDAREKTRGACAAGMVEVKGSMSVGIHESIEDLQDTACTDWLSPRDTDRCQTFNQEAWLRVKEKLDRRPMEFCIDRFEYPNLLGAYPIIEISWHESAALCEARRQRLCTEDEWTFACEGEDATPYPNGYERDESACVMDRAHREVDEAVLAQRESPAAMVEIDRLWQGEISGSRAACRSAFGVYDLTGNVDEWTSSVRKGERASILKGGYWGPVRTRCRPSTRAHGEDYSYYQQGFRCCGAIGP